MAAWMYFGKMSAKTLPAFGSSRFGLSALFVFASSGTVASRQARPTKHPKGTTNNEHD